MIVEKRGQALEVGFLMGEMVGVLRKSRFPPAVLPEAPRDRTDRDRIGF